MRETDRHYAQLVARCRETIRMGSKSFSLSAHLFGKERRDGAFLLYAWCRFCDDEIDEASLTETPIQLEKRLDRLKEMTELAFSSRRLDQPVFEAFQHVVRRYAIPMHYPFELLEGMAMDIRREPYPDLDKLLLYSYRVAGTVGLMMSHVMGLSRDEALRHASDLGTAMQLTNISRDVLEDAKMGRVYLPEEWLRAEGIGPADVPDPRHRPAVARVVARLLDVADTYYRSGDAGLRYLSFRCACTIASARYVYSEIGAKVRRRGTEAWDTRTWVGLPRKLCLMMKAIGVAALGLPRRWLRRWKAVPISVIWRHALIVVLFAGRTTG